MKNISYIILIPLLLFGIKNATSQNNFERCATVNYMEYRESVSPGYIENTQRAFDVAKDNFSGNRTDVYEIPVVVHVVYNTPEQNLADSIIFAQIQSLNEDYRRKNADTINMRADFQPHVGDPHIQFRLAEFDENGDPTTGITRTSTTTTTFFDILSGDLAEGVKSSTDGGIDPWDQSKYLNIWVCNMDFFGSPMVLGYATPPDGLSHWPAGSVSSMSDGVVIQYQVFGRNNPNTIDMGNGPMDIRGRTVTHEVGHYLGLRHIWGDGGCTEQDGIADTPNADAQSDFDCDNSKNTCTDNIGGVDLPDMIENFMDYSAETCQNSYTTGQVNMMRSVIENHRPGLLNNGALSVNEVAKNDFTFKIYPNPTDESFTLQLNSLEENYSIEIYSINGKVVLAKNISQLNQNINVSFVDAGIYIVCIKDNKGVLKGTHRLTVL